LARLEGWPHIVAHPSRLAEDGSHLRMTFGVSDAVMAMTTRPLSSFARFEGTHPRFGLVLFAVMTRLALF